MEEEVRSPKAGRRSQKQRERRDSDLGQGNQGLLGRKQEERALVVQRPLPSRAPHSLCPTATETGLYSQQSAQPQDMKCDPPKAIVASLFLLPNGHFPGPLLAGVAV